MPPQALPETAVKSPSKPWKQLPPSCPLFPPSLRPASFLSPNFMRGLFAICIFAVFSLTYISILPGLRLRLYSLDFGLINASYQRLSAAVVTPTPTNMSHILFGIGGSSDTWNSRRHYCELWWKPNVTRGFVWLDEEPENAGNRWPSTSPPYRVSADTSRFKYTHLYGSRSAIRLARIVKESFELRLDDVRWFVMGDDDTVFFTENIVNILGKYDHNQMHYIGAHSESVDQAVDHSYTTGFGGAGFAISYALAEELVNILDDCIDRYAEAYGSDLKVGSCVREIGVPMTKEAGFHQMDIQGNAFGILSAHPVALLASLHHLDFIQPLFHGMNRLDSLKKLLEPYRMDPTRTVQQSFCYDPSRNWSVSISWGYSLLLYPYVVSPADLSTPLQTFLTWTRSLRAFTFDVMPASLDPCLRPIVYHFNKGEITPEDGSTRTLYTRPRAEYCRLCTVDHFLAAYKVKGFNVTAPLLDPRTYTKAPRRQCCEVMNGSDEGDGIMRVKIRECYKGESVMPLQMKA